MSHEVMEWFYDNRYPNVPEYKSKFLKWMEQFARIGTLKRMIERLDFSEQDLLVMKPQIEASYKLKKKFEKRLGRWS